MIYGKTNCEFEIHSHYEVWGFTIAVKDLQGNHIAEYDLSQVTGIVGACFQREACNMNGF